MIKKLILISYGLLLCAQSFAGDYHNNGQSARVVYFIEDNRGKYVAGQTPGIAVQRVSDDAYLDFNSNTFKFSGWTTRIATMSYNSTDGYYFRTISIDNGGIISGDYVAIVSNDDSTYGDRQIDAITWDSTNNLIKIHR